MAHAQEYFTMSTQLVMANDDGMENGLIDEQSKCVPQQMLCSWKKCQE